MIHYHGADITPRSALLELAGRHFCVSFAYPYSAPVCHEIGQSVMLDNGAFTHWRQGMVPDWTGYYEWCASWLDYPTTWAVIPDVIDGDEDANDALVEAWPFGNDGAPVWHLHESLSRLERLADTWPLVCLGSSGMYRAPGSLSWTARMDEAMEVLCDERGRPCTRLHMLRGLGLVLGGCPFPFYSADSSSIARNHKGDRAGRARKDPRTEAERFDSYQPAPVWVRGHDQLLLETAE